MSNIFKFWLTMCSLVLTLTVYLVKENILVNSIAKYIPWENLSSFVEFLPKFVSFLCYFLVVILFTWIGLLLTRFLGDENIPSTDVKSIEPANDTFLPSYLGYFFVALSISDFDTFIYVFGLIFIFVFFSKISYFNPIFLLFKLKFFYVTNGSGTKIVLITRKDLKEPNDVVFDQLKRINNYTFISREK
ncbi:hypothetical protein BCV44_04615 [Vibrio cyclitrophicus]|uniref:hypothetical protein n=1 Tax=Vibrio TaxID=662 RepID=UPI0006315E34|nr:MULTISPECIES: hypothetical protein [Vibrio]PME09151.1 hypothetical protein BCV44_04615 [Vibrio cyclitrophicus]RLQ19912.1 hypothetical protein AYK60_07530 [Vibrio sp. SBT000027]CDU06701.1 conserved membrane hypothetical protein [Vibrio coralliirubri]